MCEFDNGFILCSCELSNEHTNTQDDSKIEYIWELRILKSKELAIGRAIYPEKGIDIGCGLNAEWVLLNLNCEKCFDFDFEPKQGDNLVIYPNTKKHYNQDLVYLSYIYKEGKWQEDFYDELGELTKLKNNKYKGKVKTTNDNG